MQKRVVPDSDTAVLTDTPFHQCSSASRKLTTSG